ncbi:MAG: ABC transporter permease [Candidatus Parcubacteria bacterium]|nr:ABC transporter permease [Candidatus Parcubacteria bacterium]
MAIIKEYFKLAIKNLRNRKLRSWLTIFGIVVGIFLVITLISLSGGIKNSILKQLNSLGGDVILVMPGAIDNPIATFMGGQMLSEEDILTIKKVEGVDVVLPTSQKSQLMRYNNEQKVIFLVSFPWDEGKDFLSTFQGWSLSEGTWPSPGKREILLGSLVAQKDFFGRRIRVGDAATINGRTFRVVGILNSIGSKSDDTSVYLDRPVYQQVTGERDGSALMIMVKAKEGVSPDELAAKIKKALDEVRKRKRGENVSDFSVLTSEKMGNIAGGIVGVIQAAVMLFASISILVGGLGIMNTMFTSVRERTKEIGVLKAVGAKNSAVISIFLIESGILGLIGGAGGVIFGLIVAKLIEGYSRASGSFLLEAYMPASLIIFGLFFSFLIGCLSGYLPARKAAKLRPTDALRGYE